MATISINAVVGSNGLIAKAEQARDLQRASSVEEEVELWKSTKTLGKYVGGGAQTRDQLVADLVTRRLLTETEKTSIEETGSVTIAGKTIVFGNDAKTLVEMFDAGEIKIGDYVNYQNPTSGSKTISGADTGMKEAQTFDVAKNQLNWRVLGKDEATGGLKLIAGSPMKSSRVETENDPYFYMYGAKGYINAETNLNNICALYKNDLAVTARSVTIEDVNQVTGVTVDETGRPSLDESNLYGQTYSYTNQYATPEDYLAGKRSDFTKTGDFYGYMANNEALTTASDTNLYNLLFDNVEYGTGRAYWLASRCVDANSGNADFGVRGVFSDGGDTVVDGINLFDSNGGENDDGLAVRPVVILGSDVTVEDIQVVDAKNETPWNYTQNPIDAGDLS